MDSILQRKLDQLASANQLECWYIVKQSTDFDKVCYLVSYLDEYQRKNNSMSLEDLIKTRVAQLKSEHPDFGISANYRALRVAAYFGLIEMQDNTYQNSKITDVYREVFERCGGNFIDTDSYSDIIQRQIEKMYISTSVDEKFEDIRKNFRLYPIMLLYKVLLELGRATGEYKISLSEYRYIVGTTEKFEDFLDALLLIRVLRNNEESLSEFEQYGTKFDNRMYQVLKQLATLSVDGKSISLIPDCVDEVAKKVYLFESNPNIFETENYLDFLGSKKSLFDLMTDDISAKNLDSNYAKISDAKRVENGKNILLYGVPGCGKSYTIQRDYCDDPSRIERIVFHPDYMNTDLVGQILPTVFLEEESGEKIITYKFTPGPLTRILKKAYEDPGYEYFLIIEEINRGNAPAIFGELFQLLDREPDGSSSYGISNENIADYVYGDKSRLVSLPSNLSILATMNTADQNVFTLDTAFQRRWRMKMIINDVSKAKHANEPILDTGLTWKDFNEVINDQILSSNQSTMLSEDKRLGAYFITLEDLTVEDPAELFAEKVIKYLWDDAFKFSRAKLFNKDYKSLEEVVDQFVTQKGLERFNIFLTEIKDSLKARKEQTSANISTEQVEEQVIAE